MKVRKFCFPRHKGKKTRQAYFFVCAVVELDAETQCGCGHASVVAFLAWLKDPVTPNAVSTAGARFGLLLAKRTSLSQIFMHADLGK